MKDTLEYKILKYLSENDNGEYLTLDFFKDNEKLFKAKTTSLFKMKYISRISTPVTGGEFITYEKPMYKIEFLGSEYLNNLEKSIIELKLTESNIEANRLNESIAKKNEESEKFNKYSTISNIIIGLLNIGILVWQILKPE